MTSYKDTSISLTLATIIQQSCTYWLKTVIKNQYVYGTSIPTTFNSLFNSTDYLRFNRGISPSILKVIIGRNSDILLHKFYTEQLSYNRETTALISGLSSSVVKLGIIPLDTISNLYQVHGCKATDIITKQYTQEKHFFYRGTLAYMTLSGIGSSVWLYTYSRLNDAPLSYSKNVNNAVIGVSSSIVSDLVVNPIRILKTYKQSNQNYISYQSIIKNIMKLDDSIVKSYFRGYGLRGCLNAFNSGVFMVLWKQMEE